MSIIGFIVLGDRTSHGGVVLSGDPTFTVDGQPVARVGDSASCPRCKRLTTIVSSRFPSVVDGKPVAYDQDKTDCGALVYSRHNGHAGWSAAAGEGGADTAAVAAGVGETAPPRQAPRFQEHFILRNNDTGELLSGIAYTITTGDGQVVEGETDAQGRTEVVWTDSPLPIEVVADPKPREDDDPYHYDDNINYGGL